MLYLNELRNMKNAEVDFCKFEFLLLKITKSSYKNLYSGLHIFMKAKSNLNDIYNLRILEFLFFKLCQSLRHLESNFGRFNRQSD